MTDNKTLATAEAAAPTTVERTRGGNFFTPRVDIFENSNELILLAEMPGVGPDQVDLRYERGELILHGKLQPRQRQGNALLREYDEGDYYRVFQISEAIDSNRIEAKCKSGILTVHLPKAASAQPKQVKVSAN